MEVKKNTLLNSLKNTVIKALNPINSSSIIESADYPNCYYRAIGEEVEWLNPPMIVNTEYKTTERFLNRPVYTMVFPMRINAEPTITKRLEECGLRGLYCIVDCIGTMVGGQALPFNNNMKNSLYLTATVNTVTIHNPLQIAYKGGTFVQIKYTKI